MKPQRNILDQIRDLFPGRCLTPVLLALILGIAAFWRFYHLDYRCLWYDEVQVVRVAERTHLADVVLGARGHMSAPPVDYLLRRFWQQAGGVSDAWIRAYGGVWGGSRGAVDLFSRTSSVWVEDRLAGCTAASHFLVPRSLFR